MKYKILIIEDEVSIRETLEDILEIKGYEVFTAKNGEVGLNSIFTRSPDLVICDINMPVMNGFEVLERVKDVMEENPPPFIFLTAKVEKTDINRGISLGAKHYITKPFSNKDIFEAIQTTLNKS